MPLAFIVLLVCVEVLSYREQWRRALSMVRTVAVLATTLATVAAFLSGYQASSPLGDLPSDIQGALSGHHAYGRLLLINALVMATLFWILRVALHGKRFISALYLITLSLQLFLTVWVGTMGGALVFDHGVGVHLLRK